MTGQLTIHQSFSDHFMARLDSIGIKYKFLCAGEKPETATFEVSWPSQQAIWDCCVAVLGDNIRDSLWPVPDSVKAKIV